MAWKRRVLVVANVTATSGELLGALVHRAARDPVMFTVLVPATRFGGGRSTAHEQLAEAIRLLGELGLEADGQVADADPMVAVAEAWDPLRYDEIILSTLPESASKWLAADLPRRIEKHTGALLTHVVARPVNSPPTVMRIEASRKRGVMTPLSVLTWGARR